MAAAAAVGLVTFACRWYGIVLPAFGPLVPVLAGALLVFGIGLLDDVRPVGAPAKLLVQVLAAIIVMASGVLIERLTVAGHTWQLGVVAVPVTLVWIVGLTNAFNLIDGIDGLAAGVATIAGATCAVILAARGHMAEAMLLTALVGAALGFLCFNFAPASIFLGDGGSLVFGFVLASTAITGWQKGATALAAGVPLLIFALPLADSLSALMRRLLRRDTPGRITAAKLLRQVAEPDRDHIHHRLTALGWSTRQTVLLLYALTATLSGIALLTARFD
jgi:UDP-GlcNAc:undecaprenyl-phosphate/decaprenyl-phosphate GlcNAc-1-phosphate transferase